MRTCKSPTATLLPSTTGRFPTRNGDGVHHGHQVAYRPGVYLPAQLGLNLHLVAFVVKEANYDGSCAGIITWCHTFSPSKMWINGFANLQKPYSHYEPKFHLFQRSILLFQIFHRGFLHRHGPGKPLNIGVEAGTLSKVLPYPLVYKVTAKTNQEIANVVSRVGGNRGNLLPREHTAVQEALQALVSG